jgi:tetratricopeptide (TPR) repeat protein
MLSAALLAALAASAPGSAAAPSAFAVVPRQSRTLRLTAPEMFRLADIALANSDFDTARGIYSALGQDPNSDIRAEAWFRHAKYLMQQNRNREAAVLLRRVLDEKPGASAVRLELAHQLQLIGDPEAALRELRAAQASRLPPAVARLVDRYAASLRAARPYGFNFEVALAPDSNISRATRSDTLGTIFGDFDIDKDSQAKSGTGLAIRADAFRRIPFGGDHSILLRAGASADLYRHGEFNDIAFDLAAGSQLRLGRREVSLEAGATQRWYGQKPFVRSVRLGATLTQPLGTRAQLRLSANAALIDNRMNDLQDGKSYSGQASLERALSPATGVGLSLGGDRMSARDPGYSTTGWRVGALAWREMGRATLTAQAEFGRLRADERLSLFPDKRSDSLTRITLGATFRQLTVGGFAPVTRLVIERNKSSIEFYDYKRVRTEFGIARAF